MERPGTMNPNASCCGFQLILLSNPWKDRSLSAEYWEAYVTFSRIETLLPCVIGFYISFAGNACVASAVTGNALIYYELEGTLEEGGEFFGTFAIDPLAMDSSTSEGYGTFELADVEIHLVNTSLFTSGGNAATSGTATEALLAQSQIGQRQTIAFTVLASNGLSNAFSDLTFMPFTGDADIASSIEGGFASGYFDGNGQSPIATLSIVRVPEPSAATIACLCGMMAVNCFQRRIVLAPAQHP